VAGPVFPQSRAQPFASPTDSLNDAALFLFHLGDCRQTLRLSATRYAHFKPYAGSDVSAGNRYSSRTFSRSRHARVSSDTCFRSRAMTSRNLGHLIHG
jgi:hypothetical protein